MMSRLMDRHCFPADWERKQNFGPQDEKPLFVHHSSHNQHSSTMAKKTATGKAPTPAVSASSIDDIFANPSAKAPAPAQPVASSSKSSVAQPSKAASADGQKKKKKKATKTIATFDPEDEAGSAELSAAETKTKAKTKATGAASSSEPVSRAVEVVEDPSLAQIAAAVKAAKATAATGAAGKVKKRAAADEEDEMFRDSRGTGPSQSLGSRPGNVADANKGVRRRRAS